MTFQCKSCGTYFRTAQPQNVYEPTCRACRVFMNREHLAEQERRKLAALGTMGQTKGTP